MRRFSVASDIVDRSVGKVRAGDYDHSGAARALNDVLNYCYFAPNAPIAEFIAIKEGDQEKPIFHGHDIQWMGMNRTTYHRFSAQKRLEKLLEFLVKYPEADPELLGHAILEIRGIYLYEFRNLDHAHYWLTRLQSLPEWRSRSEVELLCSRLLNERLDSKEGNEDLISLEAYSEFLPFDNGRLPVITLEEVRKLRSFSDLLLGKTDDLAVSLDNIEFRESEKIRSIPVKLLMHLAAGKKNEAFRQFQENSSSIQKRDQKFLSEFLFPLYKPVNPKELPILSATLVSERFPIIAIDTILSYLVKSESHLHSDHILSLLSDLYQKHRNYIEAQSTWSTLRVLYPQSVWIR